MSAPEKQFHLRDLGEDASAPRVKPPPDTKAISVPFTYAPSDDGTDENLLVLLHGLGDTHVPFAKLGRQLKLPQTATLALQAPEQIPLLPPPAFQWYPSFTPLGERITVPNPTPALTLLRTVLAHLTSPPLGWPPARIHLLGFAQGAGVAAEAALRWWRDDGHADAPLGSVVLLCGGLIEFPTRGACPTPVLVFHRPPRAGRYASPVPALRRGFANVREVTGPTSARWESEREEGEDGGEERMPASREEWEGVMRFWSEQLARRKAEGVYEVLSGGVP